MKKIIFLILGILLIHFINADIGFNIKPYFYDICGNQISNECSGNTCCGNDECSFCKTDCLTCCGDKTCDSDETCDSCPEDCGCNPSCLPPTQYCDCDICLNYCGNGICGDNKYLIEDCNSCPEDCGCEKNQHCKFLDGESVCEDIICGNGICDNDETIQSCPSDCKEKIIINSPCTPNCQYSSICDESTSNGCGGECTRETDGISCGANSKCENEICKEQINLINNVCTPNCQYPYICAESTPNGCGGVCTRETDGITCGTNSKCENEVCIRSIKATYESRDYNNKVAQSSNKINQIQNSDLTEEVKEIEKKDITTQGKEEPLITSETEQNIVGFVPIKIEERSNDYSILILIGANIFLLLLVLIFILFILRKR